MVSSDFGKLEVRRHLISGEDCAIAGAAIAVAAAPAADTFTKSRRFIQASPLRVLLEFDGSASGRQRASRQPAAFGCRGSNTDIPLRKRHQGMRALIKRK